MRSHLPLAVSGNHVETDATDGYTDAVDVQTDEHHDDGGGVGVAAKVVNVCCCCCCRCLRGN